MFNREFTLNSVLDRAIVRLAMLLLLFVTLLGFYLVDQQYRVEEAGFHQDVRQVALQIVNLESHLSSKAVKLAENTELHQYLESQDVKAIIRWTNSVRKLVPEISGLAILDSAGKVIGDAFGQGITEHCQLHALEHLRAGTVKATSIQDRNNEHWDVAVGVGNSDYILLASFPLQQIVDFLEQTDLSGNSFEFLYDGEVVSRHGDIQGEMQLTVPVTNAGWYLSASANRTPLLSIIVEPLVILTSMLLLAVIIMHLWSRKLSQVILQDLRYVQDSTSLLVSENRESIIVEPRLYIREYKEFFSQLKKIVLSIHQDTDRAFARDPLTSMPNEHQLQQQKKKIYEMALRNIDMMLVMLDIDDLNSINMVFGKGTGDRLVKGVADIIKGAIRSTDDSFYLGNGHFLVVLVAMKPAEALKWYEFLTRRYEMLRINLGEYHETSPEISVSAAAARVLNSDQSFEDTMYRLQAVMKSVKKRSKGIIVMARDTFKPDAPSPQEHRKNGLTKNTQVEEFHHPWQ